MKLFTDIYTSVVVKDPMSETKTKTKDFMSETKTKTKDFMSKTKTSLSETKNFSIRDQDQGPRTFVHSRLFHEFQSFQILFVNMG